MSLTSGGDTRIPTIAFNTFPLNAVVGVDATYGANALPIPSSGITIAPNHVLTAGHSAFQGGIISNPTGTTVGASLTTRTAVPNVTARYFPKNFDVNTTADNDIALLRTSDAPITAANAIGLLAFEDASVATGLTINTAGYPGGRSMLLPQFLLLMVCQQAAEQNLAMPLTRRSNFSSLATTTPLTLLTFFLMALALVPAIACNR